MAILSMTGASVAFLFSSLSLSFFRGQLYNDITNNN
jgi:hypothetical protein